MISKKSRMICFLLSAFFGLTGFHRFYVGKIGTGLLYFLTAGFCGLGVVWDELQIILGNFTDKQGYVVSKW